MAITKSDTPRNRNDAMSLHFLGNSPLLVASCGTSLVVGLPFLDAALASSSLALLKGLNLAAFATNVAAVSVPGRLDGAQDAEMRRGNFDGGSKSGEGQSLVNDAEENHPYMLNRSRTLINPSGWAFAIWAPIYLGEAAFVAGQLLASDATNMALLPSITAPFVAANLFQSLWCASFRPTFGDGWKKWVSAAMLGGTAYSLSLVHSAAATVADLTVLSHLLLPVTMHFGWTSAATLVNLNGSLASDQSASTTSLIALGHSSALVATALGVSVSLLQKSPAYGFTLAWALAACSDGMRKRIPSQDSAEEVLLSKAATVQRNLCKAGAVICAIAASYIAMF